jgi:hypothetical protein
LIPQQPSEQPETINSMRFSIAHFSPMHWPRAVPTARHVAVAVLIATLLIGVRAPSADAADAIFPTGSRLGLVPPAGMVASRTFQGFQDPIANAAILLTALPATAYDQLAKSMMPEVMKKQGIEVDRREPIELPTGKGFLLSGRDTSDKEHLRKWVLIAAVGDLTALINFQAPERDSTYPEKAVRAVFATLTVRPSVPEAEQLSLIPFKIGEMAGFHVEDVLPGRAIVLADVPADQKPDDPKATAKGRIFIAILPGGPEETGDRDNFARVIFGQIVGIKGVQIQDAGPLRIANQPGYQTLAKAKDAGTGADVMVVQWLRFGAGGFLRMIGIARADAWSEMFARLRTVRDSVATN